MLYADDILIIAPSVNELHHLVNICELELAALDMLTNAKKSCCLRIGRRHNVQGGPKKVSHYQESSLNSIKNFQCGYISHQF